MQAFMSQSQPCCITSLPAVYLNPHVHQSARKPTDTQALAYREPLRKKTVIENNENKVYFLKHSRVNCPPHTHTPPSPWGHRREGQGGAAMAGAALTTLVRISWRRGEALASTTLLLTSFPSTGFSAMAADTAARPCPSPPLPPPPPSPAGRPYNGGGAEPRQAGRAGRGWVGAVWRQGAVGEATSPPRQ